MTKPPRSLATRLVLLAIAQMAIFLVAAFIIWFFTAPHGPHGHHEHGRHLPIGHGHPFPWGPLATLAAGFIVLAVGAWFTARWLLGPIQSLSRTATSLGEGDLGARSGVTRKDEIGELGARIDQMGDKIAQMLQHERELLANVAHELRTPLARIGVALDLANEGDSERARSSLAEIAVDVGELEVIVDDLLTALRYDITRGASMPLRRARTSPASIATLASERMRARHPERPLELSIAKDLPDIDVDPMLFRRVIDNLLDNAHKYTPESTSPILLIARRDRDHVELEVVDRGIGIATADLPNIYNSFFRADRSRSREAGGVGLGLTLAKRIVEAHGGQIEVQSQAGKGTRARVRIPVAPVNEQVQ